MHIGILTNTFDTKTPGATAQVLSAHGLTHIQLELASVGMPALPDRIDQADLTRIRQAFDAYHIVVAAVSGTFNMIHPEKAHRQDGLQPVSYTHLTLPTKRIV